MRRHHHALPLPKYALTGALSVLRCAIRQQNHVFFGSYRRPEI